MKDVTLILLGSVAHDQYSCPILRLYFEVPVWGEAECGMVQFRRYCVDHHHKVMGQELTSYRESF
jgi:hypothetical protein